MFSNSRLKAHKHTLLHSWTKSHKVQEQGGNGTKAKHSYSVLNVHKCTGDEIYIYMPVMIQIAMQSGNTQQLESSDMS